jgi:outer membrane protein assembly factor BamA
MRVFLIGLGAGTMASYGRTNDVYRFYEINPQVITFATNTQYFTYITDSAATIDLVLGDARKRLEHERFRQDHQADVLVVDAYSGELPIYEKLFLGGPRTIRGVEYRDIGQKVYEVGGDYAPIGGQTMAMATAEYTVPVFKAVRLATFMDVGSLGEDAFDPELSDVCVSVGIGIRIDIPGFPIRFDFAKPVVEDDDYTDEEVFSFAIGFE